MDNNQSASATDMREYYNATLRAEHHPYEHERWGKTAERRAAFAMTRHVVHTHVCPLLYKSMHVLEVGAGPGTWTKELFAHDPSMSVDIVDISDEMLAQARIGLKKYNHVRYIQADFDTYVPERTYDLFFSSRALEYMPDKVAVAATIARSLKSGGKGCIITKYPHYARVRAQGKKVADVHALQVSPGALVHELEYAGLKVTMTAPVTFVFPKLRNARLDMLLFKLLRNLPLRVVAPVVESYFVSFEKP